MGWDDAARFATGFNKALRPNSAKAAIKAATEGMDKQAAKKFGQETAALYSSKAAKSGSKTAEAIMKNKATTGIANTIHHMDGGKGFKDALRTAHLKDGTDRLSKSKMAGTAFTVGVTGRVATGGGLYRDRYGNVNLPGVPFI